MAHIPNLTDYVLKARTSQSRLAQTAHVDRDTVYRAGAGFNVNLVNCAKIIDALNTMEPFVKEKLDEKVVIAEGGKPNKPRS
jgi:hypothetical protein